MNFSEEAFTSVGYTCFPPGQYSMHSPTADGWSSWDFLTKRGKMSMSLCCHRSRRNPKIWHVVVATSSRGMNPLCGRSDNFYFYPLYSLPFQFKFYITWVQVGEGQMVSLEFSYSKIWEGNEVHCRILSQGGGLQLSSLFSVENAFDTWCLIF